MKTKVLSLIAGLSSLACLSQEADAQIVKLHDYVNNNSAAIGTFQNIKFREAGFSGLYQIPGSNGKEFWTVSDRGVNIDGANANSSSCRPTYDKIYAFPSYAPKIHRIRVNGDSIHILQTITLKRPDGTGATGIINPAGFGSTATEVASTDTVVDCLNFNAKIAAKDVWGIDSEGITVDKDGNFWICEEGGPTIWKVSRNGVVLKRYSPYAALAGAEPQDTPIDTVFRYRKNNRGLEGITITPNGKIYAIIQSPLLYPTKAIGESSRIHRIIEVDPSNGQTKMFAYINDGVIGASGPDQIRARDWKIGDMVAINNDELLVIEAAARGNSDIKKIYKIDLSAATPVHSGLYNGQTLEALVDEAGLLANTITPVSKSLFMDLLANGWPAVLDKAEGITIINDSTLAIVNDNDYGQISPLENGIATPTGKLSHMLVFRLQGQNKISNYLPLDYILAEGKTGLSSSQSPYLIPTNPDAHFTSVLTAGDVVNGYKAAGTPDGSGAFDNGDGTFTLLVNHEFGNTAGGTRAHGSMGAFVSKWIINKSDLSVVSGSDLIRNVYTWNTATGSYVAGTTAFARFCSADLAPISAYYNIATGKGTQERIFMNGEENGNEGRAFAHIATGPAAGTTYELPRLGKFSWENSVAHPYAGDKTIVAGTDDATPGQVYIYIGTKTNSGSDVEKAGLTNGKLYGITVTGYSTESNAAIPSPGTTFTLSDLDNVENITGATLNTNSNNAGVTTFLRPEDGAWDPSHPNDLYFVTTNGFSNPSRLWRVRFTDYKNPELGGTIDAVLDGTEGQKMLDNMTIDHSGHILLQEDVGGNAHIGKMWQYTIATDALVQIAQHDETRFLTGGASFLTQDEEVSGILDAQSILGPGMFLLVDQAHYSQPGEVVEGGQILAFFNPETAANNPEIGIVGNNSTINSGDNTPSAADNTDFGMVDTDNPQTKNFVIANEGTSNLLVSDIVIYGANGDEFEFTPAITFPLTIAPASTETVTVKFSPTATGVRNAKLMFVSSDYSANQYTFALQGTGTTLSPTSIVPANVSLGTAVSVYPNPVDEEATVTITMDKQEAVNVGIYDAKGALVSPWMKKMLVKGPNEIRVATSSLDNGTYFIQISSGQGTARIKTVVMH